MTQLKENIKKEIEETRKIIKDFADHDLYSANCGTVKHLYKKIRRLENELNETDYEEDDYEEDNYEPYFIGGSDVPICGDYE